MDTRKELKILFWFIAFFLAAYFLPVGDKSFMTAIYAAMDLLRYYAREHVILCLLPAFFIAGVIAIFVSQGAVIKYFGANTKKWISYSIASVSGTILAVCSCTILPLFSSIHKRGAGLGPAVAFLYSGPAINILAIILTARILGIEMGIARIIGAVVFAIVIGLVMAFIYRKEEKEKKEEQMNFPQTPEKRPLWQTSWHFFTLVLILVFANWGAPSESADPGLWHWIFDHKWQITALLSMFLIYSLIRILKITWWWVALSAVATAVAAVVGGPVIAMVTAIAALSVITLLDKNDEDNKEWTLSTWEFARQIMPLLAIGVVAAGFLLGSTHGDTAIPGIIPSEYVTAFVGDNSIYSNLFASVIGAFMYFATLTEVPILQGLLAAGMNKGPALALLLAGPSLSLPNLLVIRGVMGTQKTVVYALLVIIMATISGMIYGSM